jgi:hypothetical protein
LILVQLRGSLHVLLTIGGLVELLGLMHALVLLLAILISLLLVHLSRVNFEHTFVTKVKRLSMNIVPFAYVHSWVPTTTLIALFFINFLSVKPKHPCKFVFVIFIVMKKITMIEIVSSFVIFISKY